ncbi:MAG: hypothetical protein PSV35_07460 [bacterium]|nr:hypothetical protein [bacterium]
MHHTANSKKNSVNPNILAAEKQKIHFDKRPWQASWSEHNDHII